MYLGTLGWGCLILLILIMIFLSSNKHLHKKLKYSSNLFCGILIVGLLIGPWIIRYTNVYRDTQATESFPLAIVSTKDGTTFYVGKVYSYRDHQVYYYINPKNKQYRNSLRLAQSQVTIKALGQFNKPTAVIQTDNIPENWLTNGIWNIGGKYPRNKHYYLYNYPEIDPSYNPANPYQ